VVVVETHGRGGWGKYVDSWGWVLSCSRTGTFPLNRAPKAINVPGREHLLLTKDEISIMYPVGNIIEGLTE
jgi:hypothetical protein